MAVRRLAGLHVGGRPLSRVARALASASHYRALIVAFTVYVDPLGSLRRYLFGGGRYPYSCRLRTPAGALSLTLHHPHDIRTVNEIFCRGDYATPMTPQFVVDVGANIGVSGAYFLTRENGVRCHLVEPNPRNVALLQKNLDPFSGRWTIDECAVSDFDGYADFGTEESGRYGALGSTTGRVINVCVKHVNTVLGQILEREDHIDLLKIDIEGLESHVVDSISPEILTRVRYIIFEGRVDRAIQPHLYSQEVRGECTHLDAR